LYSKFGDTDFYLWSDASEGVNPVKDFTLRKNAEKILNYNCDELVLTTSTGLQKYFFAKTALKTDAALFTKHTAGNWYDYISKAGSLPLKIVIETDDLTIAFTATKIEAKQLLKEEFTLPKEAVLQKNNF
jgi:hypothetical protein